jgi:hypothetical protein
VDLKRIRFFCSRPLCEISTFPLLSWAFVVCAHLSLFLPQIFQLGLVLPLCHEARMNRKPSCD